MARTRAGIGAVLLPICLATTALASTSSRIGLPRIESRDAQEGLSRGQYETWEGSDATPLKVAAGEQWRMPFRNKKGEELYVTVGIIASAGSAIRVGEVDLRLAASVSEGFAELLYLSGASDGDTWKSTGVQIMLQEVRDIRAAVLPVLTFRFPEEGPVYLYADMTPVRTIDVASSLRNPSSERALELRAGKDGAWLVSVTQADANPLFPDGNKNGLDDDFEAASEAWARGAYPTFEQWQRAQTLLPTDAIRYDVPLHLLERAEGRQP